jgi:hypothetical protein
MHGFPTGGAWLNKVKVDWFLSIYKICSCHTQVPDFRWPMKKSLEIKGRNSILFRHERPCIVYIDTLCFY